MESTIFTLLPPATLAYGTKFENYKCSLFQVMEILERNKIKLPGGGGGSKRRKSENFAEARSVKIKMENTEDSAHKSMSRIHQCK